MSIVFFYDKFNEGDLGDIERKKLNSIIEDLEKDGDTQQGKITPMFSKGNTKYLHARLSHKVRLVFMRVKHDNKYAFVMLEIIPDHNYGKSHFLESTDKTKTIKITEEIVVPDTVEVKNLEQVHWLGKLLTFSATQEDIVENAELPLVINGAAGSGKTSVALEKLRKIEEKFEEGKVLYVTKSESLTTELKKLYEYECYDKTGSKLKIGVQDRVEFLSLHEFLQKLGGNVEKRESIDRSKFFSWFNKICKKGEFKRYAKDGDKIFEEFTAVIAGRDLTKEQYKELGNRQVIFSKEERDHIYSLFEEYKEFIEKDSEYYDPNLIAYKCTEEKVYDAVVVDEVQDLTESTLSLILKSLKDESKGNFLLCGDVNQMIHPSFFSESRLKSFLNQHTAGKNLSIYFLKENYRNSQQVIELANRVLHLKNYCFPPEDKMGMDKKETFFMKSDAKSIGNVCLIINDEEQKEVAKKVSDSTSWVVLVLDDKSKESARKLFNTPLVFNIHEAKGLEFENVILYKFTSNKAYNEIWKIVHPKKGNIENTINEIRDSYNEKNVNTARSKDKGDKSSEEYKFYMNALYVGVTRAINSVCIIDDEEKCNLLKAIKPEGEKAVSVDIKKEESTPKEWKNMALKLINEGNIEQAKDIAEKLSNKKHTQEIMSALEAKKDENRESLDKNRQAISKLKIGPKRCSKSEAKISAKNSDRKGDTAKPGISKAQQNQNENQKKKLEKLEENKHLMNIVSNDNVKRFKGEDISQYNKAEIFRLALEKDSLKIAEYLVVQGIDINAKTEKGLSFLHLAAESGYYDIVALLLNKGAEVDAKYQRGATPLHFAVLNNHKDVAELLLHYKADIEAKAEGILTPLHFAIRLNHEDV